MIILLRATFLHLCRNSNAHSVISYNGSSLALSHGPRMAGTGADPERQFTAGRYLEADSQQTAPRLTALRPHRGRYADLSQIPKADICISGGRGRFAPLAVHAKFRVLFPKAGNRQVPKSCAYAAASR